MLLLPLTTVRHLDAGLTTGEVALMMLTVLLPSYAAMHELLHTGTARTLTLARHGSTSTSHVTDAAREQQAMHAQADLPLQPLAAGWAVPAETPGPGGVRQGEDPSAHALLTLLWAGKLHCLRSVDAQPGPTSSL